MAITVSGPMSIVSETSSRIVLRQNAKAALLVGVGLVAALLAVLRFIPGGFKILFGALLALFTFLFLLAGFWRDQVEIDLASRQWRRRSGFVGSVQETRGALDEIPAVVMVLQRRMGQDDNPSTWNVSIQAPAWKNAVVLGAYTREEDGYRGLESWAKKLKRDAADRSGQAEVRTAWDALNTSLRDRSPRGVDPAEALDAAFGSGGSAATGAVGGRVSEKPPAGSRIVVTRESGVKRIVLPPMGWNSGATFMSLFGSVFAGFGTLAALVGAHVITGVRVNGRILDGPDWGFTAIGAFFALIGFFFILAMVMGSRASEFVADERERLVIGNRWLGMTWGEKRLPKREIEGIDLSASPRAAAARRLLNDPRPQPAPTGPNDVRVRTDARVVRLARYLSDEDQRWLRDTLEGLARG